MLYNQREISYTSLITENKVYLHLVFEAQGVSLLDGLLAHTESKYITAQSKSHVNDVGIKMQNELVHSIIQHGLTDMLIY